MPRIYKPRSKFTQYDSNIIKAAVDTVRDGKMSINKAAEKYNVKRSTLQNRVNGKHYKKQGGQCALNECDEQRLRNLLLTTSHWGFPLAKMDLRHITKNYLDNSAKSIPVFKNNFPGDDWAKSFLRRHRLSLRTAQNIAPNRAAVTVEVMSSFFENLEKAIKDIPPENIANYDETNFTDNTGSRKVIFRRGVKYPENVLANSKSSTSVMFCGTAAGVLLPIYVVYKAKNVYDTWITNGPPGARYNATSHGWFESATFLDWFRTVYLPHARTLTGPKVLIGDNLSSHISEEVIQLCQKENMIFICLPANCTHIAQPLDVTFFGPLKKTWRKILFKFKMSNPTERVIPKDAFPVLMNELWQALFVDQKAEMNLKAGFRACGIFPLDKDQVLKKMDKKVVPGIEVDDGKVLSDAVLDYMKNLREPKPLDRRARKKKISTAPGQSVGLSDFIHDETMQKKRRETSLPKNKILKKIIRKKPLQTKVVRKNIKKQPSSIRVLPRKKLVSSVSDSQAAAASSVSTSTINQNSGIRKALPRKLVASANDNQASAISNPLVSYASLPTEKQQSCIRKTPVAPVCSATDKQQLSLRNVVTRKQLVKSGPPTTEEQQSSIRKVLPRKTPVAPVSSGTDKQPSPIRKVLTRKQLAKSGPPTTEKQSSKN